MPPVLEHIADFVGDLTRCEGCGDRWVWPGEHDHYEWRMRELIEGVWFRDGAAKLSSTRRGEEYRFGIGDFIVVLEEDAYDDDIEAFGALFHRIDELDEADRRALVRRLVQAVYCCDDVNLGAFEPEIRALTTAALLLAVIEDRNYPGYWELGSGFYLPVRAFIAVASGADVNRFTLSRSRAAIHLNQRDPVVEAECPLCHEEHAIPASAHRGLND